MQANCNFNPRLRRAPRLHDIKENLSNCHREIAEVQRKLRNRPWDPLYPSWQREYRKVKQRYKDFLSMWDTTLENRRNPPQGEFPVWGGALVWPRF